MVLRNDRGRLFRLFPARAGCHCVGSHVRQEGRKVRRKAIVRCKGRSIVTSADRCDLTKVLACPGSQSSITVALAFNLAM